MKLFVSRNKPGQMNGEWFEICHVTYSLTLQEKVVMNRSSRFDLDVM